MKIKEPKIRHIPVRTCVGCFKKFPKAELLAITRAKSGNIAVHFGPDLAGRSVYLCKKEQCLAKAQHRKGLNALEHGLKVKIDEKVWKDLGNLVQANSNKK